MKDTDALKAVHRELLEAILNYKPMNSLHEGYAVLLEEVEELWDEVKKKPSKRDIAKIRDEAKQVAAMALRIMCDLT